MPGSLKSSCTNPIPTAHHPAICGVAAHFPVMLFVPRSLWHIAFFPAARHAELVSANRHAELVSASKPLRKKKQRAIPS